MPGKQAYLIRREADGTMRTVQAQSTRGAMVLFVGQYRPPVGEEFRVKARGDSNWEWFRITSSGLRKLAG